MGRPVFHKGAGTIVSRREGGSQGGDTGIGVGLAPAREAGLRCGEPRAWGLPCDSPVAGSAPLRELLLAVSHCTSVEGKNKP